jgi:hypothetical protein
MQQPKGNSHGSCLSLAYQFVHNHKVRCVILIFEPPCGRWLLRAIAATRGIDARDGTTCIRRAGDCGISCMNTPCGALLELCFVRSTFNGQALMWRLRPIWHVIFENEHAYVPLHRHPVTKKREDLAVCQLHFEYAVPTSLPTQADDRCGSMICSSQNHFRGHWSP